MTQSIPPEGRQPFLQEEEETREVYTMEESRQLQRSLMDKVLDKAASDPLWKDQLLDDPGAAMRAAEFPELQKIEDLQQFLQPDPALSEAEVTGQGGSIKPRKCWTPKWYECVWFTFDWEVNYGETRCHISQG